MIPRTRDGAPIRARWISSTGQVCLAVERGDRIEGYYERSDGTLGAMLDPLAWEHFAKLALGRLRKFRFVVAQAVEERKAFQQAHRDVEVEPEVQELGLRFAGALDKLNREAGSGQPYAERWER